MYCCVPSNDMGMSSYSDKYSGPWSARCGAHSSVLLDEVRLRMRQRSDTKFRSSLLLTSLRNTASNDDYIGIRLSISYPSSPPRRLSPDLQVFTSQSPRSQHYSMAPQPPTILLSPPRPSPLLSHSPTTPACPHLAQNYSYTHQTSRH